MYRLAILMCIAVFVAAPAYGSVPGEAAKVITRKLAGEAAKAATRKASQQAAAEAAKRLAQETAKAATRKAAATATRHFGPAVVVNAPKFADDLALATTRLSSRNSRRLMMMAPKLAESGQAPAVVAKLTSGNADELIETLWKHREKLGAAAVVTGLLVHGDDIVAAGGEFVAKPVIESVSDNIVAPASRLLVSGVVLVVIIGLVAAAAYVFGGEATERVMGRARGITQLFIRQ